jgi:hypothetical protein
MGHVFRSLDIRALANRRSHLAHRYMERYAERDVEVADGRHLQLSTFRPTSTTTEFGRT